jgi:hypothetical protein
VSDDDYALPLPVLAEMARRGLHDLGVYWSPDTNSEVDPLDDPETRREVRAFVGKVWRESQRAEQKRRAVPASGVFGEHGKAQQ